MYPACTSRSSKYPDTNPRSKTVIRNITSSRHASERGSSQIPTNAVTFSRNRSPTFIPLRSSPPLPSPSDHTFSPTHPISYSLSFDTFSTKKCPSSRRQACDSLSRLFWLSPASRPTKRPAARSVTLSRLSSSRSASRTTTPSATSVSYVYFRYAVEGMRCVDREPRRIERCDDLGL